MWLANAMLVTLQHVERLGCIAMGGGNTVSTSCNAGLARHRRSPQQRVIQCDSPRSLSDQGEIGPVLCSLERRIEILALQSPGARMRNEEKYERYFVWERVYSPLSPGVEGLV